MESFFNQRDDNNIRRTREICKGFPSFVMEFFIGIQLRTSPLTRLNYAYDLRIFFSYLSKIKYNDQIKVSEISIADLDRLTAFDIELFLEFLNSYESDGKHYQCGERAKQRKLATLRSFFKYFFKKDKISSNIAAKVDMPKIHDKPIIRLETNEIVELLNQVEATEMQGLTPREQHYHQQFRLRDLAILTLLLGTGIRVSECVGLNIDDIDFSTNGFLVTRKGGNKSILYFSKEVETALRQYIDWLHAQKNTSDGNGKKIKLLDMQALFISNKGVRISTRGVEMLVKKYSKLITPLKKITPHKLRSTYGTELYRETQDIYIVADVLGHKDVNTTKKHYAAMSDEIRRNAAQKVKLRDNEENK